MAQYGAHLADGEFVVAIVRWIPSCRPCCLVLRFALPLLLVAFIGCSRRDDTHQAGDFARRERMSRIGSEPGQDEPSNLDGVVEYIPVGIVAQLVDMGCVSLNPDDPGRRGRNGYRAQEAWSRQLPSLLFGEVRSWVIADLWFLAGPDGCLRFCEKAGIEGAVVLGCEAELDSLNRRINASIQEWDARGAVIRAGEFQIGVPGEVRHEGPFDKDYGGKTWVSWLVYMTYLGSDFGGPIPVRVYCRPAAGKVVTVVVFGHQYTHPDYRGVISDILAGVDVP